MRIRRIAVENFRKLRDPVEIGGLQPGLNVIVGDNEEGKSTLLKAVQAAFFYKHGMTGKAIKEMLPFGSQVQPKVEIQCETGEASYSLRKGFYLSSFAKLTNAEKKWENAAAEEKLRKVLQFTPPHQGAARKENMGLSGPLWVEQGHAYEPLELTGDAKKALDDAVASEVEAITSGDDGPKLLAAVEKEYHRYYTPKTGAEKAILTDQGKKVESLQQEGKKLTETREEYDDKLNDLEEIMRGIPKLRENFEQAQKRVEAVRAKVRRIENIEREIANGKSRLEVANVKLEQAKSLLSNRKRTRKKLSDVETEIRERGKAFATLDEEYNTGKVKLDQAKNELEQAQRDCKIAKLNANIDKLDRAEGIANGIAENNKAIREISIGNEDLNDLRELQSELHIQRARLEVMETTLVFSPSKKQSVSANGENLEAYAPFKITEKTLFKLEGFGELEVMPGGEEEDIRSYQSSVNDLQRKLSDKLGGLGFASVEDTDEAWRRKEGLLREVQVADGQLKGLAPTGLESLRSNIARLRENLPPTTTRPATPVLSVKVAEEKECDAQDMLGEATVSFSEIGGRWNKRRGVMSQLQESIARLQEDLENDRKLFSDEDLERKVEDANKAHKKCQKELGKLNAKLEELIPDSTRKELDREEQFSDGLRSSLDHKVERKIVLEAGLAALGHMGIEEEINNKIRECEQARMELARLELDANAWKLLRNTLQKAKQDEKVPLTPLMERLAPYVEMVFPDAKLHLNKDSLEIDKLHRENASESFDSLSIGTREQIAVLVRLAMADLLREQGKPVMLILDDPLVNSDDGRFDRMACALRRAAKHLQILILTCHETRYKSLGANTIRLMKREGRASIAKLLAMPNAEGIDFEPARLSGNLCKPADLS